MRTLNGHAHDMLSPSGADDDVSSWNFIPPDASGSTVLTEDPELERYLVAEIARAARRRPLMKRLANIEAEFADTPQGIAEDVAPPMPPPLPTTPETGAVPHGMPEPTVVLPIDQLMEEFGEEPVPLASAEWVGNAGRARRRSRVRTVFAWIATLAIGAAIVAIALPLQG
jgi:hypothetical protein